MMWTVLSALCRQLLAIETDVKQAVRILEERIARREAAEAALKKWRRQLPPKVYMSVCGLQMSCWTICSCPRFCTEGGNIGFLLPEGASNMC